MARTKREEFVADVATELFIDHIKQNQSKIEVISFVVLAHKCVDAADAMHSILVERELVK
jgi:hypothetical protein